MTSKKKRQNKMAEIGRRGAMATALRFLLDNPHRPQPSLPRVLWLERPDPLEPEKESAG